MPSEIFERSVPLRSALLDSQLDATFNSLPVVPGGTVAPDFQPITIRWGGETFRCVAVASEAALSRFHRAAERQDVAAGLAFVDGLIVAEDRARFRQVRASAPAAVVGPELDKLVRVLIPVYSRRLHDRALVAAN